MDRLKQIKTDWIVEAETYQFRQLTLEEKDIEWLIKQAEKAEELQRRIDKVIKESAVNWINLMLEGKRD